MVWPRLYLGKGISGKRGLKQSSYAQQDVCSGFESESAEEAIAVKGRVKLRRRAGSVVIAGVAAAVCFGLSGCLVIGYSSQGRWWVWPGSLAVTVLLVALWWLTRR